MTHWTARSTEDFAYRIASDFVAQIETKLEDKEMGRAEFAKAIGVTPGRVSQVLNNPTYFNLKSIVNYAKAVGMKVSIVAYDDGDLTNREGPINAQVFASCWQRAGRPRDLFEPSRPPVRPIYEVSAQRFYRPEILPGMGADWTKIVKTETNDIVAGLLPPNIIAQQHTVLRGSQAELGQKYAN
jgi:predicted XRE-type DNA-binding protein